MGPQRQRRVGNLMGTGPISGMRMITWYYGNGLTRQGNVRGVMFDKDVVVPGHMNQLSIDVSTRVALCAQPPLPLLA